APSCSFRPDVLTPRPDSGRVREEQAGPLPPPEESMADYTPYQQKIINRYYDNQDAILRQRLAELVGELFLATDKKRQRTWASIENALQKLGIAPTRIDHLKRQDNPALIAEVVKELEGK